MKDDIVSAPQDAPQKPKKSKHITFVFNRNAFYIASAVIVLVVVFFLGSAYGSRNESKTTKLTDPKTAASRATQNRWTSIGTVQEVSDTKIKVKDSRDEVKEATINKETKIVDRKGTTLKPSDIKKDSRVIISGTKDEKDEKKLTATRIRLQQ